MRFYEADADNEILDMLISLSVAWEAEHSCTGYRANTEADIEGNRIFLAEENGETLGYLFGKTYESKDMTSVMPEGTPYFEVEEIYVVPERRGKGIGSALFRYVEDTVKSDARYVVLSTATKNWKAILHFYIEELGMTFWNARLYKEI